MKRILVPTDFSKITEDAFQMSLSVARKMNAEIFLVNVIEPIIDLGFSASGSADADDLIKEEDRYIYELHKVNERRLNHMASKFMEENDAVYPTIAIDKVGDGIVDFANKYHVDLIIMGTSGENTFEEYFIGNHTEQVMRETHCPVLAVRKFIPDFDIKNVVIATDLKTDADKGMKHLQKVLESLNPKVHLIHITKSSKISVEETNNELKKFAEKYNLTDYSINIMKNGSLKVGIQSFANEVDADLIVAYTHGRKGLAHIFKGNISEELVKQTSIPVMSIHFD
jgi:nucleotide-binding universal stress UspA family protein